MAQGRTGAISIDRNDLPGFRRRAIGAAPEMIAEGATRPGIFWDVLRLCGALTIAWRIGSRSGEKIF